jgi:predicted nucleotidyltransferase component of viral defense system
MPVLRVRNAYELQDVVDASGQPPDLVARDFALMVIAARLTEQYPDELCFKGGFVLRHVHGHQRFSADIDATRIRPPMHKLDADEMTAEISRASLNNLMILKTGPPATDSGRSLDFDRIEFSAPVADGVVAVEISYREDVRDPQVELVGEPYYEPFPITVLSLDEIIAEKLRALCQRARPTDLSDQAMILARNEHDPARVRAFAVEKLKLVKDGDHQERIAQRIAEMARSYAETVPAVAPDAPPYRQAAELVLGRLSQLLP